MSVKSKIEAEERHADLLLILLEAMDMTMEGYFKVIHETGTSFIAFQANDSAWDINVVQHEAIFWNWFKRTWHMNDELFFSEFEELIAFALWDIMEGNRYHVFELRRRYNSYHEKAINHPAMGDSYSHLIRQLIKGI